MGTEGQTLPDGALGLLPIIDTIATKLKVEVGERSGPPSEVLLPVSPVHVAGFVYAVWK
jgi:hypothetical protein